MMATLTRASANSPASISPVGPPPAITTAFSVTAMLRPTFRPSRPAHHALHRRTEYLHLHCESLHRPFRGIHPSTKCLFVPLVAFGFSLRLTIMRHDPGLAASPPLRDILKTDGSRNAFFVRLPRAND